MTEWTLRLVIPREEDGGVFPVDIILDEDDEGRDDIECDTRRYVPDRETCHIVKTWSDSDYDEDWRYHCSECGCLIPVDERDPETGDVISAANYCPSCGRRVIG